VAKGTSSMQRGGKGDAVGQEQKGEFKGEEVGLWFLH
jgi:hypothetical protein